VKGPARTPAYRTVVASRGKSLRHQICVESPLCALVLSTHVPRHARSDVRDRRDGLQLPRTTLVTAGRVFGRLHAVRACFYDAVASDANLHTALSPSPPRESHALRSRARLAREVIARTRDRADSPHRHSIRRHARARARPRIRRLAHDCCMRCSRHRARALGLKSARSAPCKWPAAPPEMSVEWRKWLTSSWGRRAASSGRCPAPPRPPSPRGAASRGAAAAFSSADAPFRRSGAAACPSKSP